MKRMDNDLLTSTFIEIRQRLTAVAMRILRSEDDAADAVQDAFCKLWQRRDRIHSQSEAQGLSVTTVKNLCIDSVRRNSARVAHLNDNDDFDRADADDGERAVAEAFEAVSRIIDDRLTPVQQKIVRMREYAGISFEDIAQELKMSETAVRMQLSRARKLVREQYRKTRQDEI